MFDYGIQKVGFLQFLAPLVAGAGSIIGGAISAVPAVVGGVAEAAGGLVGGAASLAGGALSGIGELAGGVVSGTTSAVSSLFSDNASIWQPGMTTAEIGEAHLAATGALDVGGLAQVAGAALGIYQSIEQQNLAKEQLKLYEKMLGQEPTEAVYVTPSFSTITDEVLRPIEEPAVIPAAGFDLGKFLPYILIGGITIIFLMKKK